MYGEYFILLALMFTGYALRKLNVINQEMNHGLNKFIVYFAYPCMIIHNIGSLELNGQVMLAFFLMLGCSIITFAIYAAYVYWYSRIRKFPKEKSNVAELAEILPNDGYMGFPVALIFFGEKGLLFMLAHNAAYNLFCFTYGLKLIRRNKEGRRKLTPKALPKAILKVLLNPNILGVITGFLISIPGNGIPKLLDEYLLYMGQAATPMAMIFIGSTLSECKFREMIQNRIVVEGSINKLIVLPAVTVLLVFFLPLDPLIKTCLILGCAFPTGATAPMLAEQEGEDQKLATKMLFLSTVASMATIPLIVEGIQRFIL